MSVPKNIYVGKRYIPKQCGLWDNTKNTAYESLSVVLYEGASFTSKQDVPQGIDINNSTYWVRSADYNAQVAIYEQNVRDYHQYVIDQIGVLNDSTTAFQNSVNESNTAFQNSVNESNTAFQNSVNESNTAFQNSVNSSLSDIAIYSIKHFGATCDGITDDTEAIRLALNYKDNIKIKLPDNATLLITDIVKSLKNNVILEGGYNSKIKLKDNSGLLEKYCIQGVYHYEGLVGFYGAHSGIRNVEIDGNIYNNAIIGAEDGLPYMLVWKDFTSKASNITGQGGYNGVYLFGEYSFAEDLTIRNIPWSGVSLGSWGDDGISIAGTRYVKGRRVERCYITNTGRDAIPILSSERAIVRNNHIYNCLHHPIHDYTFDKYSLIENNRLFSVQSEKVDMYPGHIAELGKLQAICINHSTYTNSINYGSVVRNNYIEGDFSNGIMVQQTYTENFTIEGNTMINVEKGISCGIILGYNKIVNNTIYATEYAFAWSFSPSTPSVPSRVLNDYSSIVDIVGNRVMNKYCQYFMKFYTTISDELLGLHNSIRFIIENNTINAYKIGYFNGCNDTYTNLAITSKNNLSYLKPNWLYVSAIGDNHNTGLTKEAPLATVAQALQIARYLDLDIVIRVLDDINEDIKIINSNYRNNVTIEGYDGVNEVRITRTIGSLYVDNANSLYFYNLKPTQISTEQSALMAFVKTKLVRVIDCDLTVNAERGIISINGTKCVASCTLDNKNRGLIASYGASLVATITNVPINMTTSLLEASNGGVIHKTNTNLDGGVAVKNTGGVIYNSVGALI